VALAQAGQRVVVVDADLHRPRMHRLFGLPNALGLTTSLLEEHPAVDGLLQPTGDPRLRVLTSGPIPPNPTELLGSSRMRELLASLAQTGEADIVLVDSPPVLLLADAAVLSTIADGVLLVVEAGRTRRDAAAKAAETLRTVKARLIGVLINRAPTRGAGYYYYYYAKDYGPGEQRTRRRSGFLGRLGIGKQHGQRTPRSGDAAAQAEVTQ
jgi:non-specific protein-tyrosine kinase